MADYWWGWSRSNWHKHNTFCLFSWHLHHFGELFSCGSLVQISLLGCFGIEVQAAKVPKASRKRRQLTDLHDYRWFVNGWQYVDTSWFSRSQAQDSGVRGTRTSLRWDELWRRLRHLKKMWDAGVHGMRVYTESHPVSNQILDSRS